MPFARTARSPQCLPDVPWYQIRGPAQVTRRLVCRLYRVVVSVADEDGERGRHVRNAHFIGRVKEFDDLEAKRRQKRHPKTTEKTS